MALASRPPAGPPRIYTVAELVGGASRLLETSYGLVWVEGEVSNLRIVGSGHAYFTLKDGGALLPAAMWRSSLARLRFRLQDGQRLRVSGRLGIYPQQGKFQLYAERAEPAGLGAVMLQLEQLRKKLAAEGLFAQERKRPLPRWPRIVGVVTSPTGAAIHDVLKVLRRRCPSRVLLSPAVVQGDEAPASLRRALARLQAIDGVDVIILGRGGGASEDLWAFNDEALVRAVAACPVPVIAAVSGLCIGGGVDLITACDLRLASADAQFSVRETKIAIVADLGTLQRLPKIVGPGHARELAFTGKDIDAARAAAIGLVNSVYADADALHAAALALAQEIADNPPLTVRGVKDVMNFSADREVAEGLAYVAAYNAAFLASEDLGEAAAAFFARRAPKFRGA